MAAARKVLPALMLLISSLFMVTKSSNTIATSQQHGLYKQCGNGHSSSNPCSERILAFMLSRCNVLHVGPSSVCKIQCKTGGCRRLAPLAQLKMQVNLKENVITTLPEHQMQKSHSANSVASADLASMNKPAVKRRGRGIGRFDAINDIVPKTTSRAPQASHEVRSVQESKKKAPTTLRSTKTLISKPRIVPDVKDSSPKPRKVSDEEDSSPEMEDPGLLNRVVGMRAGTRLRSRAVRDDARTPAASEIQPKKENFMASTGRRSRQDYAMAEMLRKNTILTKQEMRGLTEAANKFSNLYTNPGYLEQQKSRESDGGLGCVTLSELNRRGLLPPPPPFPQELQRGKSSVLQEKNMKMAVFALAVVGRQLFCAGSDQDITIWDMNSWRCVGKLSGHTSWVNAILVDEARGQMYTASDDKTVRVWDLSSQKCVQTLSNLGGEAHSLVLSRDKLVVGCQARICVFDTRTWVLEHRLMNHTQVLRSMSDGKQMSKNLLLDERLAQARLPASLFGYRVGGLAVLEPLLLTAVDDGTIWVWDSSSMQVERKLIALDAPPGTWVRPLVSATVKDKRRRGRQVFKIISGWSDGAIRIFDMITWEHERTLRAHNGPILSLEFVNGMLVSAGADMVVLEWDPATWTIRKRMTDHKGAVSAAVGLECLPPAGAASSVAPPASESDPAKAHGCLVTASVDGFLKVWSCD